MGSGGYDSTTFRPGPSASTGSGVGGAAPGAGALALTVIWSHHVRFSRSERL